MNRPAQIVGAILIAFGLTVFVWKSFMLDLPLQPSDPEGLWGVEFLVKVRGGTGQGSIRVPLPSTEPGQVVFDERSISDRLRFTIRSEHGQRIGVWSGTLRGSHEIAHGFRVQLAPEHTRLSAGEEEEEEPARGGDDPLKASTVELPSEAPEIAELLSRVSLPSEREPADRARILFAYVNDEIATIETGSEDALLTLASREGSPDGKVRLLATLLRAAGIPARPVLGIRLTPGALPQILPWVEARVDGEWVSMSPTDGFFGARPKDLLVLRRGSLEMVEATGASAVAHRVNALRERLRPEELAAMMVPPNRTLAEISLYRLPVGTQAALRALLLLPLGALVVAFARNVLGIPTFGTFMPILIAFTLRETSLTIGLAMVVGVLALGVAGRVLLDRLHLLLVPRLSILLCIVVLAVTTLALFGREVDSTDLFAGVLFPIVILTMLVERFSITLAEEGLREALIRAGWSVLVAVGVYPIFRSPLAEHLMFGYPELLFVIMGLLVLIGAYTGYRLADLLRFRSFAQENEDA
ncbi:MAG: hypothetical protein FJ144_08170 [Deltaproteobacteria bacterium]|nr:hypothetical protein [Deltaproteobacteria bacterium]